MTDEVRCTGIVVQVGPPDMDPGRAPALARAVARRRLRGSWKARSLSEYSRDVLLIPASGRTVAVGRAWELARTLAADRDVARAEPAFRTSGLEPEERAEEARPELGIAPRSFGRERHLACTKEPTWSLTLCRVQDAWKQTPSPGGQRYGKGIVIGHPDTGYTLHDEIWDPPSRRRILPDKGYDFEDGRADPRDPLVEPNPSHGTSTASVLMSSHGDGLPDPTVSGVAPEARLIPFRVSDSVVHFDFGNVTSAIYECVGKGAHVISMSLGGPVGSGFLEAAIDFAVEAGVIVLAAAGNVWPWVVYPARYPKVIAVAAVNCRKQPWKHSASGGAVDISAPGESVWRALTKKGGSSGVFEVDRSSGTSYAVATAAGVAALWLAHHGRQNLIQRYGKPQLSAVFREVMQAHGFEQPTGWNTADFGPGILRADALLAAPLPPRSPAAPQALRVPRDAVGRIAEYLPGADRARLRTALAQLLHLGDSALDETLALYEDELVFHVATNPMLRADLLARSRRRAAVTSSIRRRGAKANDRLRRETSRPLRKQLGIDEVPKRARRRRR